MENVVSETQHDVVIIGGGPGGSTAAALLAEHGRKVVLFEKEVFPRFHIGESLLPYNLDLFDRLGLNERLHKTFVEKWGAHLISSTGVVTRYIKFAEGWKPGHPMAYHVLRSEFDHILLQRAAELGADVREGHPVVEATHSHRDGCVVTARRPDGSLTTVRARFLLDASGQDAFIASRRRLRKMTPKLRKAAVFAHYEGVPRGVGRGATDITLIVLSNGWFWVIPLADGKTSVGLVTEGAHIKESGMPPTQLLEEAIRRCPAAQHKMRHARRISDVWTASDYSYECGGIAGDGYLLIGDAAAFIDPVFSTGVWLAMSSGELAADTVHRALGTPTTPGDLSPAVFAAYERKVRKHVATYTEMVTHFYQPGFFDLFLQPSEHSRLKGAVVSLLAGFADPPPLMRFRLWWFYKLVELQQHFKHTKPVPLLKLLEEAPPDMPIAEIYGMAQ